MTGSKTLFFSSFLVFCTAVLSGSYLSGDKNNYGNLNSSVEEKILNSHTSHLTQTTKNWENIQQNINEVNNLITNSTKSLTQEESRKNELTQKEKDNSEKFNHLTETINNLHKTIKLLTNRDGIKYERSKNILNTKNLETFTKKISYLNFSKDNDKKQIEELAKKFLEVRGVWKWYIKNRTTNNQKAITRKDLKAKLEDLRKKSEINLNKAKNNLEISKDLIKQWQELLKDYAGNLKVLTQEEKKLMSELKSIFSKISKI